MMTVRSDSLATLQAYRGDDDTLPYQRMFHPLNPMKRSDLFKVIAGPAQRAEIELEPGLVGRIVDDVKSGEALPLLAFTMQQLHSSSSDRHHLTIADYERLGGVAGAVETHANSLLSQVGGSTRDDVRAAFLSMVQLDETGTPLRQHAPWASLDAPVQRLLQQFVEARLLVRKEETVEIAHEALFEHWPKLRHWIDDARDALHTVRQVESAAREWASRGRPARLEWSDERVVEAIQAYEALRGEPADDPPARSSSRPSPVNRWRRGLTIRTRRTRREPASATVSRCSETIGRASGGATPRPIWCGVTCRRDSSASGRTRPPTTGRRTRAKRAGSPVPSCATSPRTERSSR